MAGVSCKTCAYLGEQVTNYPSPVWLCRRSPPFAGGYIGPERRVLNVDVTPYPIVDEQCWCGEHQDMDKNA